MAERMIESSDGFGHLVFDAIRGLLTEAGMELNAVDCFASASGPGSFTGVRVGLAVTKGFAEALGKPAVGVSNLRALAWCGTSELRVPVIDARRGEVYAAAFDGGLGVVLEEHAGPLNALLETLGGRKVEFITRKPEWLRSLMEDGALIVESPRGVAELVGRCALDELARGTSGDPALLEANYVRRSDAELFWRE